MRNLARTSSIGSPVQERLGGRCCARFGPIDKCRNKIRTIYSRALSCLVSRTICMCGRAADLKKIQAAFRDMIKPVIRGGLRGLEAHRFTTSETAAFADMLDPCMQATVDRLRYFQRAVHRMPKFFWHLVDATSSRKAWKAWLMEDFEWIKAHHPKGAWPPPDASFADWRVFVNQCADWKTRVKKAAKAAIRFFRRQAEHKKWRLCMRDKCASFGVPFCMQDDSERSVELFQ